MRVWNLMLYFLYSNIIHGSDTNEGSAAREIALWFRPEELINWQPTQNVHVYEKLWIDYSKL